MPKKTLWTYEQMISAIAESYSIAEVCRKIGLVPLGGNYKTVNFFIKTNNLDTKHFSGQGWSRGKKVTCNPGHDINTFLTKNSSHSTQHLKHRLLKEGLKEYKCESCGFNTWLGEPIPLELDHIDGDKFNNIFENLRLLCPNCHSQTPSYRGKNKNKQSKYDYSQKEYLTYVGKKYLHPKQQKKKIHINKTCSDCDKIISESAIRCKKHAGLGIRAKITWPDPNDIVKELQTKSYLELSKELGVSDNAIRRYLLRRDITPPKGPMISKYLRMK